MLCIKILRQSLESILLNDCVNNNELGITGFPHGHPDLTFGHLYNHISYVSSKLKEIDEALNFLDL